MPRLKKIKKSISLFLHMPYQHQGMLICTFFLTGIVRAAVLTLPLRKFVPYFGQFYQTTQLSTIITTKQRHQALRIGKLVRLAAKYTPWNANCLTQAIVAKGWCRLFKIPHVLYIGFAKSVEDPNGFKGHAWLTAGPVAVTGGHGHLDYSVVSTYVYFTNQTTTRSGIGSQAQRA